MESVASLNVDTSKFLAVGESQNTPTSPQWKCYDFSLKMLEEGLHADVTLTATGGSVKAHKSVLACVSPVFRAMLEHDMKEHLTGTVDVPDMSIEALQLFLLMLYTTNEEGNDDVDEGSLQMPHFSAAIDKHFGEVHQAVFKYQVFSRLGSVLTTALARNLTVQNCWYYLNSSYMGVLGPFSIRSGVDCADYILSNFQEAINSKYFREEMEKNLRQVQSEIKQELQDRSWNPASPSSELHGKNGTRTA